MPDLSPGRLYGLAKYVVVFELRLYRSLLRWVFRRTDRGDAGDIPFTYAKTIAPVMWLWIFASAAEIPLAHVLLPWDSVRIALLLVGIWGLAWMVGLLASLYVYPHLLGPTRLRVRYGPAHSISLAWSQIASVTYQLRDDTSSIRVLQPREVEHGVDLQVVVGGKINVRARLHEPTTVSTEKGDMEIVELSFFADEPRALVAQARALMTAQSRQP